VRYTYKERTRVAMVKGIEAAVAKLRVDPEHPVTAEIDGLVLEVRYKGRRTAADLFREIEPLDDTSAEEMLRAIRESREDARKLEATQEPPEL
jgi:hypothetical protein